MVPDDYYIAQAGETKGPYSNAQLKSMWDRGLITSDTEYWREGMDDWYLVETLLNSKKRNDPIDPATQTDVGLQTSPVSTQLTKPPNDKPSLGTAFGIILLEIFFLLVDPGLLSLFLLVSGFFLLFVVIVCRLR